MEAYREAFDHVEKNLGSIGLNTPPEGRSDVPKITRSAKVAELGLEPGRQDSVQGWGPNLCGSKELEAWEGLGMFQ